MKIENLSAVQYSEYLILVTVSFDSRDFTYQILDDYTISVNEQEFKLDFELPRKGLKLKTSCKEKNQIIISYFFYKELLKNRKIIR